MKDALGHGSNAKAEGFAAGKAGTSGNPYPFRHPARLEWERGWSAGAQHATDQAATGALASGAKSNPAPTHDAHQYNASAVQNAIDSANRRGGKGRIGKSEARAIHGLLKGWRG